MGEIMGEIRFGNESFQVVERTHLANYRMQLLTDEELAQYKGSVTEQYKTHLKLKAEYNFQRLKIFCADSHITRGPDFTVNAELTSQEVERIKRNDIAYNMQKIA